MVPFATPRRAEPYDVMSDQAVRLALADAGIGYDRVQQAYVGYVYGDSTCGQAALYGVGRTGIPIVNVTNNCATGSSALFLARQAVEAGAADCVLVLGFEQMRPGALSALWGAGVDVPGQTLVAGFDNILESQFMIPPLTTIDFDRRAFVAAALDLLEERMADKNAPARRVMIPHRVIERASTAR